MKANTLSRLAIPFVLTLAFLVSSSALGQLSNPRLSVGTDRQNLNLSWNSVQGATGYRLYYAPYPYAGSETVQTLDLGEQLSLEGELPEGSSYYVAIEAYDALASSAFSNVEYFVLNNEHLAFSSDAGSSSGLTLIAPIATSTTYLIDDFGEVKHQWENSSSPGLSAYLLPSGNLLRTGNVATGFFTSGGKGGVIEELDWNGSAVWSLSYNDEAKSLHHDIEPMANGNVLALTWEDRETIWSEVIVEIEKTGSEGGNVVWRWDVFDHLDELGLNPNQANTEDWLHLNSIDYNQASNQVLVSSRSMNQLWIINKDDGSVATISSVALSGQHDAKWIDDSNSASNITLYDNGSSFSRSLELDPQMSSILFSYGNSDSEFFYSSRISGVQRLSNGNTLICAGVDGLIIEIDSAGNRLREYVSSFGSTTPMGESTSLFRAEKYATAYTPFF